MRQKEKPGVLIFWEVFDALQGLDSERLKEMFLAIYNYSRYGEVPNFGDDPFFRILWPFVKDKLDRDTKRYERKQQSSRENGLASDFARNYAPAHGIDPNDEAAKREYIKRRLSEIEAEEINDR